MELRAHSDRVKVKFIVWKFSLYSHTFQFLPPTTDDVDLMIEAKDKEQAVFQLYKLYNLETVDDDVWIPQEGKESTKTKGRKSLKKKAVKDEDVEEEDSAGDQDIKDENGDVPVKKRKKVAKEANGTKKKRKAKEEDIKEEKDIKQEDIDENDIDGLVKKKKKAAKETDGAKKKRKTKKAEVAVKTEEPIVTTVEETTFSGRVTRSRSSNKKA